MKLILFLLISMSVYNTYAQNINVYFNNDETKSYYDPYRNIEKQGADFEGIIVDAINRANDSVDLAVQELNLTNIAKALVRAKKQGVKVRVILEDSYNRTFSEMLKDQDLKKDQHWLNKILRQKKFLDSNNNRYVSKAEASELDAVTILRDAEVNVRDDSLGTKALMHHKFVIIDGQKLIVSSANFTRSGTHGDFDDPLSIGNANAMVVFNNDSLAAKFQTEFNLMWEGFFKNDKNRVHYRPLSRTKVSGQSVVSVQFSPTSIRDYGWNASVNGTIAHEIRSARKSVVAELFVFSSQEISDAFLYVRQKSRNIPIEVLVDFGFAIRSWSETLDMWGVEMKSDYCRIEKYNNPWKYAERYVGVPNLPQGDKLHHKFAIVDGQKVLFGSHNWSSSANVKNDETLLVIDDAYVASEFMREHDRLMRTAHFGVPRYLKRLMQERKVSCN